MKRGHFITLEGGEGAGKSSVLSRLQKLLLREGYEVVATREPGGTSLGEAIRRWLLASSEEEKIDVTAELLLFLAARSQHLSEIIKPALALGKIVICDRFNDSTLAYQGYARGLALDEVTRLCEFACGGLEPDRTYLLDLDPQVGMSRATANRVRDRLESEGIAFHTQVRKAFLALARQHPQRIRIIDASQPLADVVNEIFLEMRWNPSSEMPKPSRF